MANPANLIIFALAANGSLNQPAAQAVDTNGTINCAVDSQTDRLFLEIINLDDAALTVTVKGGVGAQAPTTRDLAVVLAATGSAGDKKIIGPFESARFAKPDGSIDVQFAGGASPTSTVRVYRLPVQI